MIEASIAFIEEYVGHLYNPSGIDFDKYLLICEQLGQEPDPSKMPPSLSSVSEEVRVAFFLYDMLADRWDSMAGMFLGKDLTGLPLLFDVYAVEDREIVVIFLLQIQKFSAKLINEELARKRKAEERKSK